MSEQGTELVPLATLAAVAESEAPADLPLAYIPRIPEGPTFREMLERAVGWGRR